jgi:hypothetical protein
MLRALSVLRLHARLIRRQGGTGLPMISRASLQVLRTLGIASLGAVPGAGFAQSEAARAGDAERIAEDIRAAVQTDGPQSPALIDPLTELAVLYEAEGEHALATAALEEARHVVRANYGLHTLEQAPLIQQALQNQQALGNFAMVQALEEELLELANRHPDDLRTVAIHRNIGARRMNLLNRFLAAEYPAEIYGESGLFSISRNDVVAELVLEAQIHYADAAAVILRNGLYASTELRGFELEIVRANDLFRERPKTRVVAFGQEARAYTTPTSGYLRTAPDKARAAYQVGRESYRRIITYDEMAFGSSADEAALRSRLDAYLQLADWDLLYSANGEALDQYEEVRTLLATTEFGEPLIAEIFAPAIPIVLPTFQPNPLETPASARYIDVGFEVTRFGDGRRVEILGGSPDVPGTAKAELESLIKGSRFRPRVMDGELARASPVVVRYYLSE